MIDLEHKCPQCDGPMELTAESGVFHDGLKVDVLITCKGDCEQVWNEFLDSDLMMTLNNPEVEDDQ